MWFAIDRKIQGMRLLSLSILLTAATACSPLALVDATLPEENWRQLDSIAYGPDNRQKIDVYLPATRETRGLLVFFYGGGWDSGERSDYRFVAAAFTGAGYAVAIPDYRLYPQVRHPEFLEDGARAIATLAAHPELGALVPGRTFIAGHSAGAWISAMLALDEQWLEEGGVDANTLAGVIGIAGPYDFDPALYRSTRQAFGHVQNVALTQPVHFARADGPPLLLLHGAADTTVEAVDSRILAERVQAAGGRATYRFYEDIGHMRIVGALAPQLSWLAPVQADVLGFMEERLAAQQVLLNALRRSDESSVR